VAWRSRPVPRQRAESSARGARGAEPRRSAVHYTSQMREIFQPQLRLHLEPDGEYTLNVVTLCPSSGYAAGRAHVGVPPEVRLTGETFSVLLELHARRGHALQVLTPVRHHLRHLKIGPKQGKSTLTAFAMLRGHVVGSASVPIQPSHEHPQKDPAAVDTTGWYSWLNRMPGALPSFHVSGVVHLPTPGYEARLVKAAPQGINPRELILDLKITPLPGTWPQVVTSTSVRYDEGSPAIEYTGVLVREPDGDAVHLDVEVAV